MSDGARYWLSSLGYVEQHGETGSWGLDTLTIAEERLTAAGVTRVSVESDLAAQMLEYQLQESAYVDDSDEVDIAERNKQLKDLLKRNKRAW